MELVKVLESVRSALLKAESGALALIPDLSEDDNYPAWCKALPKIIFQYPTDLKAFKKPLKVGLSSLHQASPQDLEKIIQSNLYEVFSGDSLAYQYLFSSISFLLEDCPFWRQLLSPHFPAIVERACSVITAAVCNPTCTDKRVHVSIVLKVILQALQFMKKDVTACFQKSNDATFDKLMRIANRCIVMLAQSKVYNSTTRSMSGILLGHLLNYDLNDKNVACSVLYICGQEVGMHQVAGPFTQLRRGFVPNENVAFYTVLLLRGVFSCTRSSVFVCEVGQKKSLTLLHILFPVILDALQVHHELQYHGFQVFKLWWTKIQHSHKSSCINIIEDILSQENDFLLETFNTLYRHWDSPISGVPTIVVDIFTIVIQSLKRTGFVLEQVLDDLLKLSSSVKGKYNFISALVKELGADIILKRHPGFLHSLTALLGVNHLCPIISKTYKTIVTQIVKGSKGKENVWNEILLPHLVKALFDSDPSIRVNASVYWLPVHLKLVPDGYTKLFRAVRIADFDDQQHGGDDRLLALMSISKVARSEGLTNISDVDFDMLLTALSSFNVSVRAEAFLLVCCNSKLTEQITEREMHLVETHLPLNMNSDSAIFRQQLTFCMRCFAERICDSVISCSKKSKVMKDSETGVGYIESCSDIFKVISDICANSLHPSFTYQRKKTAIDIFSTLLSTFHKHYEGISFSKVLVGNENRRLLLHLLRDSVPEIRTQSLSILTKYFPPMSENLAESLKASAYCLCTSPRAHNCESGATILQYLFTALGDVKHRVFNSAKELRKVLEKLRYDANEMEKNILVASYQAPAHGWMLALTNCLSTMKLDDCDEMEVADVLKDIAETTIAVIKLTLKSVFGCIAHKGSNESVIAASENDMGISADFCEMTQRINGLILENQKEEHTDEVLLTANHEAILASCWLCLLRGSSLLSSIVIKKCGSPCNGQLLMEICDTYVLILTSCRHRGAIEGCFESFLTACKALFSSEHKQLRNIPCRIVKSTCDSLKDHAQGSSNVTRRSAGIPLIIEAILVAEVSCKRDEIFHETIGKVIGLSQQVLNIQSLEMNDKFDFPQVHGLFILKHVFRNSLLGSHVLQYCVVVLKIAIKSLSSPLWVARNAATHLFGAVVSRMLGQKVIDGTRFESLENSVSSTEFFSHYSGIGEIILEEMKLAVPTQRFQKCPIPKPGLHPILTMLSKLTYGIHAAGNIPCGLVAVTKILLGSPVLAIRYLAAKSLLALVDEKSCLSLVNDFIERLLADLEELDINTQHGYLIFIRMVFGTSACDAAILKPMVLKLRQFWCQNALLPPFVAHTCLRILSRNENILKENHSEFFTDAKNRIEHALQHNTSLPGIDNYLFDLATMVLKLSGGLNAFAIFEKYLWSRKPCTQRACLNWYMDASGKPFSKAIRDYVLKHGKGVSGESTDIICRCIETYVKSSDRLETDFEIITELFHLSHAITSESSPLSLQCVGLLLLSTVVVDISSLRHLDRDSSFMERVLDDWVRVLSNRTSESKASEPLRTSASLSLKIAGCTICRKLVRADNEKLRVFVCGVLSLLHDEQPVIRKHACEFVVNLVGNEADGVNVRHQNIATKEFMQFIFNEASCSVATLRIIFCRCFKLCTKDHLLSSQALLFDKEPFNMYEEPAETARTVASAFLISSTGGGIPDSFIVQSLHQGFESIKKDCEDDSKSQFSVRLCHIIFVQMLLKHPNIVRALADEEDLLNMAKSFLQRKQVDAILNKEIQSTLPLLQNCQILLAKPEDKLRLSVL